MSLTRRSLVRKANARFLSSDLQPRGANVEQHLEVQAVSQGDEKDKLYSRLEIELKGIEPEVMKSYAWFATRAAEHLGIKTGKW